MSEFECRFVQMIQHSAMHLIMKEGVTNEILLETFHQYDVYDNEMEFYECVVPKFNEKLAELNELDLLPTSIGVWPEKNILILEDLSIKGYHVRPPTQGFDMHETKAILQRMATFHAICAALQEKEPNIFKNFKRGTLKNCANRAEVLKILRIF